MHRGPALGKVPASFSLTAANEKVSGANAGWRAGDNACAGAGVRENYRVQRLGRNFFKREVLTCARELVGCGLVWGACRGVIVETEAYAEHDDPACHTVSRPSTRGFIRGHPAGSAYVYLNYGVHWMLNVLTTSPAGNGLILIRALRPVAGVAVMCERRAVARRLPPPAHDRWLCSGPGKLAAALAVTGDDHGRDLCARAGPGFLANTGPPPNVAVTPRIGISQAVELPWRFLLAGDVYVSQRVWPARRAGPGCP
jgi:DNA-3-methyladenine glycosylase